MKTKLVDLFLCNSTLLLIGLITLVSGAAFNNKCFCPNRNQIELSEEFNKAVLFSPRFPRPYCGRLDCEWRVSSSLNSSLVRFTAPKIDLRPNRDYILFYDGNSAEPAHNCTGRMKNCEFISNGPVFMVKFKTGKGSVDKYGFQATLTLLEDEFQNLSDNDNENGEHKTSSAWNFFVSILLVCVIVFILAAAIYWLCKRRRRADDNRSPLLDKSSKREDSIHISLAHEENE
ncbi:hypothetical protein M3Y97_00055300 [Aphelenchoides bicaudatus]|nr:hypothetical protein M3Y97_00055300 [Aphelenchoides bicaudatus]